MFSHLLKYYVNAKPAVSFKYDLVIIKLFDNEEIDKDNYLKISYH
jgi:hypothetical protein